MNNAQITAYLKGALNESTHHQPYDSEREMPPPPVVDGGKLASQVKLLILLLEHVNADPKT